MDERVIKQSKPRDVFGYPIHEWQAFTNNHGASLLWLVPIHAPDGTIERFGVARFWTDEQHRRQGYATALYKAASQVAPVWHATGDRLTADGAEFAAAVGGPYLTQAEADQYLPPLTWLTRMSGRDDRS